MLIEKQKYPIGFKFTRIGKDYIERSKIMSITKNIHGAYVVSDIIEGYLVTRQYYGYTKKEALRFFQEESGES